MDINAILDSRNISDYRPTCVRENMPMDRNSSMNSQNNQNRIESLSTFDSDMYGSPFVLSNMVSNNYPKVTEKNLEQRNRP